MLDGGLWLSCDGRGIFFFFGWVTSNSKRDYGEAATFLDRDCLEKQSDLRL
jgi:hypothetical protein